MLILNIPSTHQMKNNRLALLRETLRDPISPDFQQVITLPSEIRQSDSSKAQIKRPLLF